MVTDQQVRRLLKLKQTEKTLSIAASKAGMSEKTARKYLKAGKLPSQMKKPREWRTREDDFSEVWPEIQRMLEVDPSLQGKTLFRYLCRTYPNQFQAGQLRTLQRRIKAWKAIEGPQKEVMFPQERQAGVQGQSDFTRMTRLGVTINHEPFDHMLYHFVLPYFNWEWGSVCFSESLESLKKGLQDALWKLGGVPKEHRTDNLSAAVNNLQDTKVFNANYQGLVDHYRLKPTRNHPGRACENGDVEQSHHRLKETVDQELKLRGSRDFQSRQAYETFLQALMMRRNQERSERFAIELGKLRNLPERRLEDWTECRVKVCKHATIKVRKNVYSVDSRLIGEQVAVRVHADHLEIWYGNKEIDRLPRLRGSGQHRINYRHIIDSLVRKPGAFANYRYRNDLFPRFMFRLAYQWLEENRPGNADKEYVSILELAAKGSEEKVDQTIRMLIRQTRPLTVAEIALTLDQDLPEETVTIVIPEVRLMEFDGLLEGYRVS